jgi:uncharacterized protein involved in exopolysaccharide biosynthesis
LLTFRVIDPPTVPRKPVGPNRPKLFSAAFAAALIAGIGLALLIGQIRPTFLSQSELQSTTGLPVLGSVMMNWTDAEKIKRRRDVLLFGAAFAALILLYAIVMAVTLLRAYG